MVFLWFLHKDSLAPCFASRARYLGPVVKTRLAAAVQDETGKPCNSAGDFDGKSWNGPSEKHTKTMENQDF